MKKFVGFFLFVFLGFFYGAYAEENLEPVLFTGTSVVANDKPYYKYKQNKN